MRCAALTWVLALSACFVSLDDHPGRACDDAHPCRVGRACVDGFCAGPLELDGGADLDGGTDGGAP